MAQQVGDLAVVTTAAWITAVCRFQPWPRNFCMSPSRPKRKKGNGQSYSPCPHRADKQRSQEPHAGIGKNEAELGQSLVDGCFHSTFRMFDSFFGR